MPSGPTAHWATSRPRSSSSSLLSGQLPRSSQPEWSKVGEQVDGMDDEEEISHFGLTLRMTCGAERRQLDADVRHAQARDRAFHRADLLSLARLVAHDVD